MDERKYLKFLHLISEKDIEGIRNFYQTLYNEDLAFQDNNEYYHQFLMQFLNVNDYSNSTNKKEEPSSDKNYICIRSIFHKGENEEFYVDNFYTKQDLKLHPYWYNAILFYNNLVQTETYLSIYEYSDFSLELVKQCNNLVISIKQEKSLPIYSEKVLDIHKEIFNKFNIFPRNVLSTGKEFIFVFDLMRSVNLKIDSVRLFYESVERKLNKEFQTSKKEFFLLPGSICKGSKIVINSKSQLNEFQNRKWIDCKICLLETGFQKCYYQGIPFYNGDSVNLSSLGNLFEIVKRDKKQTIFSENKKRYTNVGLQRLKDFDTFLDLRNFNLLKERKAYFEIMANVLFYLEKDFITVLNYVQEKNQKLLYPLKDKIIYSIVEFQYRNYLEYKTDSLMGIKYTNETIVKKLGITFEEQDFMMQLITKETAKLRKNYRDREYSRKNYVKKERIQKEEKENVSVVQIKNMLELGYSKSEISKLLHISRNTIASICKPK